MIEESPLRLATACSRSGSAPATSPCCSSWKPRSLSDRPLSPVGSGCSVHGRRLFSSTAHGLRDDDRLALARHGALDRLALGRHGQLDRLALKCLGEHDGRRLRAVAHARERPGGTASRRNEDGGTEQERAAPSRRGVTDDAGRRIERHRRGSDGRPFRFAERAAELRDELGARPRALRRVLRETLAKHGVDRRREARCEGRGRGRRLGRVRHRLGGE